MLVTVEEYGNGLREDGETEETIAGLIETARNDGGIVSINGVEYIGKPYEVNAYNIEQLFSMMKKLMEVM